MQNLIDWVKKTGLKTQSVVFYSLRRNHWRIFLKGSHTIRSALKKKKTTH